MYWAASTPFFAKSPSRPVDRTNLPPYTWERRLRRRHETVRMRACLLTSTVLCVETYRTIRSRLLEFIYEQQRFVVSVNIRHVSKWLFIRMVSNQSRNKLRFWQRVTKSVIVLCFRFAGTTQSIACSHRTHTFNRGGTLQGHLVNTFTTVLQEQHGDGYFLYYPTAAIFTP